MQNELLDLEVTLLEGIKILDKYLAANPNEQLLARCKDLRKDVLNTLAKISSQELGMILKKYEV